MVKNDSLITYESGILGQAAIKKFFIATFLERKIMSTKTSFKRIALVAASALAIAGFSAVPAHAATTATAIVVSKATTDDGTALAAGYYTANKVLQANGISAFTVGAGSSVALKVISHGGAIAAGDGNSFRVTMRGIAVVVPAEDTAAVAQDAVYTATAFTAPSVPGTYTLDVVYDVDADFSTLGDQLSTAVNMTVAANPGWSQGASTALSVGAHTDATTTTDALAKTAVKTLGTYVGTIVVKLRDTEGALYAGQTVTATVSGSGFVGGAAWADADADGVVDNSEIDTADGAAVTTRTATVTSAATGVVAFGVWADGTSGTASVAISVTDQVSGATTAMGTKSFTFYGSVAKIEVSESVYTIGRAGGFTTGAADGDLAARTAAHIPAFVVKTTDSAGNAANRGANPTIVSDNLLAVTGGACDLDDNADADYSSGGTGFYNCNFVTAATAKSGDKATLTVRVTNPADTTTYLSTTYKVTVGGSVAKETLTTDAATYAPGAAILVTRTATDSSGNPVYDGAASPAVSASKALGGAAIGAGTYVGGKSANATSVEKSATFAPAVSGDFVLTATSGATGSPTITATASVEGDSASSLALDAANAATDAANNAYDEAQNATQAASDALAAVTALAAQVKSLIASVKKLTAAVAKLKK